MPGRLAAWAELIGDQFGLWGLVLVLVGAWWWWRRDQRFVLFALVWMIFVGVYAFFYDTGDSHVYLLPLMLLLALWWGEGVRGLLHLVERLRPLWRRLALAALVVLPLASLALHWRAADLSDDWFAQAYMAQALDGVEPDSLVIVRGDRATFALWYGVYAEGRRPDVAVVSGPLLAYIWYRDNVRHQYPDLILNEPTTGDEVTTDDLVHDLIAQELPRRPVYATDPAEPWEAWFDFVQEGEAPIYRVRRRSGSKPVE
jgi:hypothetical protein